MMEHEETARTLAVVRYSLGEMTPDERDAFEEHYFECRECLAAVKRAETFAQNARMLKNTRREEGGAGNVRPFPVRWLAPVAATVAAAIVTVAVLIPMYRSREVVETRPIPSLTLIGALRSAAEDNALPANRNAVLSTVVTPVEGAAAYRAEVRGRDGGALQHWDITIAEAADTVPLPLRPLPPGAYVLAIESVDKGGRRSEITRYSFNVVPEGRPENR